MHFTSFSSIVIPDKFMRKRANSVKAVTGDTSDLFPATKSSPETVSSSHTSDSTIESLESSVELYESSLPSSSRSSSLAFATPSQANAVSNGSIHEDERTSPPLTPLPDVDAESMSCVRARSLDLSPNDDRKVQSLARASYSTESVMVFLHPEPSHSSVSLSLSPRRVPDIKSTNAIAGPSSISAPPAPTARLASPDTSLTLRRPRVREYTNPYPYFTTPMMFASVNPHFAIAPSLPSTLSTPKSKNKGKMRDAAQTVDSASPPSADGKMHTNDPSSVSSPSHTINFRKITSRGRLFRRNTATIEKLDRMRPSTSDGSTPSSSARLARQADHLESTNTFGRDHPDNPAHTNHSETTDAKYRTEVAVTTLRLKKEVREESGIDEVIPRLRMLRAPAKIKS